MHRPIPLLALACWTPLCFSLRPPAAGATEAARDAALVVIALRQTRTTESREAVLSKAFDSAESRPVAPAAAEVPGAFSRPKNWFIQVYSGKLPGQEAAPGVRPPAAPTEPDDPLARALNAALVPWRTLLDAAWGGAWAATPIKVLTGTQG